MLKLDEIRKDVQAEINDAELREILRASKRVIRDVNGAFPGVQITDSALKRLTADSDEDLTFTRFAVANDTIETTTDYSASLLPGDIIYLYGSDNNDGAYTIGSVSTTTISLVAGESLITEAAVECTVAFFRVWRRQYIDYKLINLTLDNATKTIVDSDSLNDFEAMGVKEGDVVHISAATLAPNVQALSVASVSKYTITLNSSESVNDDTADPCRVTVWDMGQVYSYNNETSELTTPEYIKEILSVHENDVEIFPKDKEYLADTDHLNEAMYGSFSRKVITFPSWIMDGSDDELEIEGHKDIEIYGGARKDASIDAPQQLYATIQSGVMSYLYSLPKYFDEKQTKIWQGRYARNLANASEIEDSIQPETDYEQEYTY